MSAELISKLTSRGVIVHLEANFVSLTMNTDTLSNLITAIQAATTITDFPCQIKEKVPLPAATDLSCRVKEKTSLQTESASVKRRRQRIRAKEKEFLSILDEEESFPERKDSEFSSIKPGVIGKEVLSTVGKVRSLERKDSEFSSIKPGVIGKEVLSTVGKIRSPERKNEATFTLAEIQAKRKHIRVKEPILIAYPDIRDPLIISLLHHYDSTFFGGKIYSSLAQKGLTFIGRSSRTLTKCVSTLNMNNNTVIYYVSRPLLMGINPDNVATILVNCVLPVADRMEALMQVMEHDLVHIYEFATCGSSLEDTHSAFFNSMTANLFGHVRSTHVLLNTAAKSNKQYTYLDFRKGQRVYFINAKDMKIEASILHVGEKEAVVLIDGKERKQAGISYSRLYPLKK